MKHSQKRSHKKASRKSRSRTKHNRKHRGGGGPRQSNVARAKGLPPRWIQPGREDEANKPASYSEVVRLNKMRKETAARSASARK